MNDSIIPGLIYLAIIIAIYFLPLIIAEVRNHNNTFAIGVLNLILGWTLLGWVVALVWSATKDVKPKDETKDEDYVKKEWGLKKHDE